MTTEERLADVLGRTIVSAPPLSAEIGRRFATRLAEVAGQPDRVPIEIDGSRIEARRGGTLLAAAMKNGIRLMHVCGARALCTTCRIRVEFGAENLTAASTKERLALLTRLAFDPRTRLACQARVRGRAEVRSRLPLCGNLPRRTSAHAWPARVRAASLGLTLVLTFSEIALVAIPLGAGAWLAGFGARGIVEAALVLASAYSIGIAVMTHFRPPASGDGRSTL